MCSNSLLSNSTKAIKAIEGIREEEQSKSTRTTRFRSTMFTSLTGDIDW
jgi:hypothetical protein